MKAVYVFLCALFFSVSSLASEMESCPSVENVTLRGGIYTAPTNRAGHEWIAVSSVATAPQLESFDVGVFYPQNNQQGSVGRLGYCEYKAQDRSRVNMYYRQRTSNEVSMRLANTENWKMIESGLGLVVYECNTATPGACAFTLLD